MHVSTRMKIFKNLSADISIGLTIILTKKELKVHWKKLSLSQPSLLILVDGSSRTYPKSEGGKMK